MEAKAIGAVLPDIAEGVASPPMVLPEQSIAELRKLDPATLPERLTDEMMAKLQPLACCPLPAPKRCDEGKFYEAIATWQACLPRRASDDVSGEILVETYWRVLGLSGRLSQLQLNWLLPEVLTRCKWFPTIKEILDLLENFTGRTKLWARREAVRARIAREYRRREEERRSARRPPPLTQEAIDAMPEPLKRLGLASGALVKAEDGRIVPNPEGEDE